MHAVGRAGYEGAGEDRRYEADEMQATVDAAGKGMRMRIERDESAVRLFEQGPTMHAYTPYANL